MKSALAVAAVLAAAVVMFPSTEAQSRLFTTGTRTELDVASQIGVEQAEVIARARGIGGELRVSRVHVDRRSMAHTRVQQFVGGVPVFGGEAIVHLASSGARVAETDALVARLSVDTTPRLTPEAAIAQALAAYGCSDCLTAPPAADLWILRHEGIDHLAYRVQLRREDGTERTALPVIFVDAHGGSVVWRYDNLQTGTGRSLYSGVVPINTTFHGPPRRVFALENMTRLVGTFDARDTETDVFDFTDGNDVWDSARQRAGVDVHWATERTLDYFQNAHGRNGLDGHGGPRALVSFDRSTFVLGSLVHYGTAYPNAFWNGFYMAYGDGDGSFFGPLVPPDVVAHEMTHGVTQFTAGLIYFGESGALNESISDVFGAMMERDVRGDGPNVWRIAEQAYTPGTSGDALRHLDDPHRATELGYTDDDDPDHYTERYQGEGDNGGVHINSGIPNKAFYLLAEGGTHHRGGSMTGIGAEAAARIWYAALESYMTSSTNFAGARIATLNAAAALYGSGSPQHAAVSAAWCLVGVGVCSVARADSVTPSSGSGTSRTFVLRYSDPAGARNLSTAWVWFTPTLASSAEDSCLVQYERATASLNLLDDSGTTWLRGTPGESGTLENSQCAIALPTTAVALSGSTLRLTLPVTFKATFSGTKRIFMYAASNGGSASGWQSRGTWTVPTRAAAVVTAESATPNSGSGASRAFTLRYGDTLGAGDLASAWVWFNATFAESAASSCLLSYEAPGNTLRLLDDSGTTWLTAVLGSEGTLQNSQCVVDVSASTAAPSGNTLTLTLPVTFATPFSGAKNIYLYAASGTGPTSGWQTRGRWTVPGPIVTADSVTPDSGTGVAAMFTLTYSHSEGPSQLSAVWVWFNESFASSAAQSCLLRYEHATGTLHLLDDGGTDWLAAALGGGGTLQNSQCAIALEQSTATAGATDLTVTLAVRFRPSFAGAKTVFMYAAGSGGLASGWQTRGTWTVPGVTVAAESVAPASGAGTGQTFILEYSDTFGAADLATVWIWFNASLAPSAAGSCLIHYEPSTSTLRLLDDSGTTWFEATPESGGTLQNSQCAIPGAFAGVTMSGNSLTLTLPMTFTSGPFSGDKTVSMYAASTGGATSGWQTRGSWGVP